MPFFCTVNQFHGYRSQLVFERAVLETLGPHVSVRVCEVPGHMDTATLQRDFFRELAAIALYYVRGWI